MSAHVGSELLPVNLVKNPMYITVDGTNEIVQNGTLGVFQIEALAAFTPGCSIRFHWAACPLPNNTLVMTCALMPDDSGQQYNTTYFVPLIDMLQSAQIYFQNNYYLSRDFDIQANFIAFASMDFTARNYGPEYDLTITTDDPNLVIHTSNGTPRLYNPNYNLRVEPIVCSNPNPFMGSWTTLPALKHKQTNGFAEFDLSPVLEPWILDTDFKPTLLGLDSHNKRIYGAVPFYFNYYEEYGNPSVVKKKYKYPVGDGYYYIHPGGLSKNDLRLATNMGGTINNFDMLLFLNETGSFLTSRPTYRFISRDTPDFASFYIPSLGGNVYSIKARVYYKDGSNIVTTLSNVSTLQDYITVTFSSGFKQNGLDLLSSETPYKYEVWLADEDDNEVTGPMCYVLMAEEAHKYMFMYINNYGRWEVLECRSRRIEVNEKSSEEHRAVTPILPEKFTAEIAQYNINAYASFELSTGALASKKDALAIKDFLQSEHIYEIFKKPFSNRWNYVRCLVDNGKVDINTDGDAFPSVKFNYRHASDEQSFSDIAL